MDCSDDVLALAALLEQAYRLALVVQEELPSEASCATNELIEVLDNARVSLLNVSRPPNAAKLLLGDGPKNRR